MVEMSNREEFEAMPEIAEILKYNEKSYFDEATGEYVSQYSYLSGYLNGAWYAFQEQQKKIDGALKELEFLNYYGTGNSDNAIKILKGTDK